jgi:squalene-hopene/tetraprenyl-beta-curcumene cyclase
MNLDVSTVERALADVRSALLAARGAEGHWTGRLSSSALSTAAAVIAMAVVDRAAREGAGGSSAPARSHEGLIRGGLDWLVRNQNRDGSYGDTDRSAGNISTTALAWAAFGAAGEAGGGGARDAAARAEAWLGARAGGRSPDRIAAAIVARYGRDRTFSVPILTACALAGRMGAGRAAWRRVKPLPFELAALPPAWYRWLGLPVVSYALPALIAVGQARFSHRPPLNPITRVIRAASRDAALSRLEAIQPSSGGFLEAAPLTSFVVMSLAGSGLADHPAVARGVDFLRRSARDDGSWPIDSNLATWLTTLAVNALAVGPDFEACMTETERGLVMRWLMRQQCRDLHPYTQAAPGGWAWTNLPGGVPDADDTAGALIALRTLAQIHFASRNLLAIPDMHGVVPDDPPDAVPTTDAGGLLTESGVLDAATAGVTWLLDLQNGDGGVPTFCRGWGRLPFDRSGADLSAHALRAVAAWRPGLPGALGARADAFAVGVVGYLSRARRADGSWVPLWFGNERAPGEENPVYGTSRVILGLADSGKAFEPKGAVELIAAGAAWLLKAQHADGGWGGAPRVPPSYEETALAVEGLAAAALSGRALPGLDPAALREGVERGAAWLAVHTSRARVPPPAPIGFYFAKLWYYEALYPLVFASAALGRARLLMGSGVWRRKGR